MLAAMSSKANTAIGLIIQRLWLNAAQYGSAPAFPAVGMGLLANNVFITALTMRHQSQQITLCACGGENRRFVAQKGSNFVLQGINAGVVTKHILANIGGSNGCTHGRRWASNCV